MSSEKQDEGTQASTDSGLRPSAAVWSAVAQRLGQRWESGYRRGLYDADQLALIRETLDSTSRWLDGNRPARLRDSEARVARGERFSERDVLCIGYVDHVAGDSSLPPARRLQALFNGHLAGIYSHMHVLPHFPCPVIHPQLQGPPSRADGGFEPMSYRMDPKFGEPADLMGVRANLMFDFVLNHLSVKSEWFQKFLEDEPGYEHFFLTIDEEHLKSLDLSAVFRPRQHHPVIEFTNSRGRKKHVWCTFSPTQADINIKDPRVFCEIVKALVQDFVAQGAQWIRLDAVGYLVKMLGVEPDEPRTSCFGIEETHDVLKALRLYLDDAISPAVTLVAEVNATKDVIQTYYGDDGDEAHMAYEFPVAPLSLYAIYAGDAGPILSWASEKAQRSGEIGLAFTSSHDGIGVLPMRDVPAAADGTPAVDCLLRELETRGAGINWKSQVVDGQTESVPYEACITWLQAILDPREREALLGNALGDPGIAEVADRFCASQAFALTAPHCVPADYLGAIAGLLNDEVTFARTHHNRDKNRGFVDAREFAAALNSPESEHHRLVGEIHRRKLALLQARAGSPAFSPHARCVVDVVECVDADRDSGIPVFSVLRVDDNSGQVVLALVHCRPCRQVVVFRGDAHGLGSFGAATEMITSRRFDVRDAVLTCQLAPWDVAWIELHSGV